MGYDFGLYRRKRKKMPKSEVQLPGLEAHFAATEYRRFLTQLAEDAGLAEIWSAYQQARQEYVRKLREAISADVDPEQNERIYMSKKERRRSRKLRRRLRRQNQGGEEDRLPPREQPEVVAARHREDECRQAVEEMADQEPLVGFLLAPAEAEFDSASCARIGPRIRAIAEKWEPAPDGWVGWRERALEIADAMEIAAEHPDVVFRISG